MSLFKSKSEKENKGALCWTAVKKEAGVHDTHTHRQVNPAAVTEWRDKVFHVWPWIEHDADRNHSAATLSLAVGFTSDFELKQPARNLKKTILFFFFFFFKWWLTNIVFVYSTFLHELAINLKKLTTWKIRIRRYSLAFSDSVRSITSRLLVLRKTEWRLTFRWCFHDSTHQVESSSGSFRIRTENTPTHEIYSTNVLLLLAGC